MNVSGIIKFGMIVKDHIPHILCVVGIASGVAAVATATYKAYDAAKNDIYKEEISQAKLIKQCEENEKCANKDGEIVDYSKKDASHDRIVLAKNIIFKTFKQFWLPALLLVASITSTGVAFGMINNRLGATIAALDATTASFAKYRENVKADLGEEKDEYYLTHEITKETVVDEKTGEIKEEKKDKNFKYQYDLIFDENNKAWSKDYHFNIATLKSRAQELDRLWDSKKFLAVNDILKMMEIPSDEWPAEGQILVYGPKKKPYDHFSFGIDFNNRENNSQDVVDFFTGENPSIILKIRPDTNINTVLYKSVKKKLEV